MELNEIWGNEQAKRAVEIAEGGKLSIKFIGNGEAEMFSNYCQEKGLTAYAFKPCACGNFGDGSRACECEIKEIKKYRALINQTETDLTIETHPCRLESLKRVKLPYELDQDSRQLLETAFTHLSLNQNQVLSVLKTAGYIAELDKETKIKPHHLAEALQYRNHDNL